MEIKMLRPLFTAFALLVIAPSITAQAKQKSFSWINGMCDISVRYDSAKVKDKPLRDTVYLLNEAYQNLAVGISLVSTPEDIQRLDRKELERQCKANHDKLVGLDLLKVPSLKSKLNPLRQELIETQDRFCAFQDIHMRGYLNPGSLREFKGAPQCNSFIDALEDDGKLEPAWRKYVDTLCANNASAADCSKRELDKAKLPDAKLHMRITLLSFGWNNCAIPFAWGDSDALQAKLQVASEALQKHFKAKVVCEEP